MIHILSISASDTSGGAGMQQDVKVAHDFGCWALSVLSGLTCQTFERVRQMQPVDTDFLKSQLQVCLETAPIAAVKIGALCSIENMRVVHAFLERHKPQWVVIDPVMASTDGTLLGGHPQWNNELVQLFKYATVVTPNKIEFEKLTNAHCNSIEEAIEVARTFAKQWNTTILLKGGHFDSHDIQEALVSAQGVLRYEYPRLQWNYQHGTGCTLSTALACCLAQQGNVQLAYEEATRYLRDWYTGRNEDGRQ